MYVCLYKYIAVYIQSIYLSAFNLIPWARNTVSINFVVGLWFYLSDYLEGEVLSNKLFRIYGCGWDGFKNEKKEENTRENIKCMRWIGEYAYNTPWISSIDPSVRSHIHT